MKKYIYIGITLQIFISIFIIMFLKNDLERDKVLYKDKIKILIVPDFLKYTEEQLNWWHEHTLKEKVKYIQDKAKENKIEIYKYIYKNDKNLIIYSDDIYKNNKTIKWKKKVNKEEKEERSSGKDFIWTNNKLNIKVREFIKSAEIEPFGVYYVKVDNKENIEKFKKDILDRFPGAFTYQKSNEYFIDTLSNLLANKFLIILYLVVFIINISIYTQYLIRNNNKITILKIYGWKNREIFNYYILKILKLSGLLSILGFILIIGYFYILYRGFNLTTMLLEVIITNFLLMGISYVGILLFIINIIEKNTNKIKGKNYSNLAVSFNLISKLSIAVTIILIFSNVINLKDSIKLQQENSKNWEKLKDVYMIRIRAIFDENGNYINDYRKRRPYQYKLKNFYSKAEKEKGLFVIDVDNYYRFISKGEGPFFYEINTKNELEQLISPKGKSIEINKNYLLHNPIEDENGEDASKKIIYADNIMNIFVPIKLKKYEEEIRQNYLKKFDFNKNLFAEEFGLKVEKNLKLNLIYVKDNQKYFTYDESIEEEDLTVTDPIVIINTGNFDPEIDGHIFTSACFVKTEDDGYNYIRDCVVETNNQDSIQSTTSLYNFVAENLNMKKSLYKTLILVEIGLLISFIFNIYSSYKTIINRYKYKIYIKRILGYSYKSLFVPLITGQILSSIIVGVILLFYKYSILMLSLVLSWILYELIISIMSLIYLKDIITNFTLSKKGDKYD